MDHTGVNSFFSSSHLCSSVCLRLISLSMLKRHTLIPKKPPSFAFRRNLRVAWIYFHMSILDDLHPSYHVPFPPLFLVETKGSGKQFYSPPYFAAEVSFCWTFLEELGNGVIDRPALVKFALFLIRRVAILFFLTDRAIDTDAGFPRRWRAGEFWYHRGELWFVQPHPEDRRN